jgi:co-chaperonin GroES (HSP10)
VQRIKADTKTAGGIFLPESAVKDLNEAKVLAVGPGGLDKDGKRITPSVQPGDKVLIPQVRWTYSTVDYDWRSAGEAYGETTWTAVGEKLYGG